MRQVMDESKGQGREQKADVIAGLDRVAAEVKQVLDCNRDRAREQKADITSGLDRVAAEVKQALDSNKERTREQKADIISGLDKVPTLVKGLLSGTLAAVQQESREAQQAICSVKRQLAELKQCAHEGVVAGQVLKAKADDIAAKLDASAVCAKSLRAKGQRGEQGLYDSAVRQAGLAGGVRGGHGERPGALVRHKRQAAWLPGVAHREQEPRGGDGGEGAQ